jgi:pimeloyl-ACP methyl ester carboxylesterase
MVDHLIDVDGCRLSTRIVCSGSPVVAMLPSAGGAHDQWDRLVPLLATTSITYGRPGLGGSDPLPAAEAGRPTDHDGLTVQLHDLLRAADVQPPYVLVNCSVGAWLADRFAMRWPQEVAGLVLLDPTSIGVLHPDWDDLIDDADGHGALRSWERCRQLLITELPSKPVRSVVVSRAHRTVPQEAIDRGWRSLTMEQADHEWRLRQAEWARRMQAVHVIADTAGHFVQQDQPELVAAMIDAVSAAWRRDEPLNLDREDVAAAGGHLVENGHG